MRDRRQYHKEYYLRKKQALNLISTDSTHVNPGSTQQDENEIKQINITLKDSTHVNQPCEIVKNGFRVPKHLGLIIALVVFILANTSFLVYEQLRFYVLKGYSFKYAFFISVLSETAVVFLSYFATHAKTVLKKTQIHLTLLLTVACLFSIIGLGVNRNQAQAQKNYEIASVLREEIGFLKNEVLQKPHLKSKLLKREDDLISHLQTQEIQEGWEFEFYTLTALRILSIFWNIIFAGALAKILLDKTSNPQKFLI